MLPYAAIRHYADSVCYVDVARALSIRYALLAIMRAALLPARRYASALFMPLRHAACLRRYAITLLMP